MEPHYSKEEEGAQSGSEVEGSEHQFAGPRPFSARPRRNGRTPGWICYRAGTRDPACADLLHAAEQADAHRARSLWPSCYLRSPVCSLGSPLKLKLHFCAANKHVTLSCERPVQAAAYLCVDWF